ncbi:hypothetical protein [Kumtagia ephedrae]|uniref:Uncharacterized protein n=1 Tax=Kumtagia ephedrae TaxID=2116701 RepID=A0A2P7SA32_9HYPH|nr:hypothetical protein [Mesorhizobium ephedrae]PSJ59175.1 hypothetical protein C7I84_14275 [Mesorhizobium ephedrae]
MTKTTTALEQAAGELDPFAFRETAGSDAGMKAAYGDYARMRRQEAMQRLSAAIGHLREPDAAMLAAGREALLAMDPQAAGAVDPKQIWYAMFDHMVSSAKQGSADTGTHVEGKAKAGG